MRAFQYSRPATMAEAVLEMRDALAADPRAPASFLAGGTTLLDLMKLEVIRPHRVIDLGELRGAFGHIRWDGTSLRLGAFARMAEVAAHPDVVAHMPVIAQSLSLAASAQLRNMASLGGNVLQRTRCTYFRDPSWSACNKRAPGSGCAALAGTNRSHAVLGTSEHCIATYPGDLAQALLALDATILVAGPRGSRRIPFAALHRRPGDTPHLETSLQPDEIIAEFIVPAGAWTRTSLYLKIRDRQSYEFAVASAAVALAIEDDTVREARIALGGVATIPWRAREAEDALKGRAPTEEAAQAAAAVAFAEAEPQAHNAFKVALGRSTLVRALLQAASMESRP